MTHTVSQFRDGQLVSCFQHTDTASVYRWVWSMVRFMLRQYGRENTQVAPLGFFERDGDRIVWRISQDWQDTDGPVVLDFSFNRGASVLNLGLLTKA